MADKSPDVLLLHCTGVPDEADIAFGGLGRLLEPVRPAWWHSMPLRRALGHEPGDVTDLAAYTAVLETLRQLAKRQPVLVLVDDAHAVDRASLAALRFAERRTGGEPIGFVLNDSDGPLHEDVPAGTDETLAAALEQQATEAAKRGGMAATVSVLRHAARLSADDGARARRLAAAAHAAWKTGDPDLAHRLLDTLTASVGEPTARPLIGRLRGLVELYSGDQAAAQENLTTTAKALATTDPGQAARLLFLAIDAAYHRDRPGDTVELARRIGTLACEPGYHDLAGWLAQALTSENAELVPDPWRVLDAVPDGLTEQDAHRWLVSMAISRRGPHPEAAREFGLVAAERLRANGILALYTVLLPWLADLELRLGRWDDARAHAEEAALAAADTGQRATSADAHACLARLAALTGDASACRHHAELVLREAPAHNALAVAQARWALGSLHLSRGEHDLAAEHLGALGHREIEAAALTDRVEALVYSGAADTARALLTKDIPASCAALLARDAEPYFLRELAQPDTSRPFELARCRLRYGQWLRRERRIGDAKVQLRTAWETFENLGAVEWAKQAAGELRAAGSSAARTPAMLTAQELQVAELAASGLSNREIGSRLFLSPRTVGYHLYKMFPKLGIASRAQLRDVVLA